MSHRKLARKVLGKKHTKVRRLSRFQRWLALEQLEARKVLTGSGFLQGTAFVDTNQNNALDPGEPFKVGATIELRSQAGALITTTTTDSNGQYLFSNLSPATYRLTEIPTPGYVNSGTQILAQINSAASPATQISPSTVQVTVVDPASVYVNYLGRYQSLFAPLNLTVGTRTGNDAVGPKSISLGSSPGLTDLSAPFVTFCIDLFHSVPSVNNAFQVLPETFPTGLQNNGQQVPNSGQIAYLYNHFGRSFTDLTGAPMTKVTAAAFQVALWELLYDPNPNDVLTGTFRLNGPVSGFTTPAEYTSIVNTAVSFINAASGKAEQAVYLDATLGGQQVPETGRQGMIATGIYNFANVPSAAIGDYVWLDRNANGQQDGTESGVDGLTVNLLDSTGTNVLFTTTTGDNPNLAGTQQGYYEFNGLAPGSYVVQFFTGAGYSAFTALDVGADASDSDANPLTGKTAIYTLVSGQFNQTVDAGLKPIDLSLTKTVSNSAPAVGDNVTFTLTVNNANGFSTATGVNVTDVLPAGLNFVSATPSQGTFAGNIWTIGTLTAGQTVTLALTAKVMTGGTKINYAEVTAAGQLDLDSTPNNNSNNEDDDDQVSLTPTAAIGDYVWLDLNANGQQDLGEPGIDGLMVQLLDSTGTNLLFTTTTGDDPNTAGIQKGYYDFKGLTPGSYVVQFYTGSGYNAFTGKDSGADATDSDADIATGKTAVYTLASGEFNQTVDAGLRPIDLSLTKSVSNSTPAVGDNVTFTVSVNNANGFSTATGVQVKDVLPAGLTFVSGIPSVGTYSGNTWTIGTLTAGQTVSLVVTATVATGGTKTNYAEVTAANQVDTDSTPNNNSTTEDDDDSASLTPTAAIGDYVWLDRNADGQQNLGEFGIDGLTVKLLNATGTTVLSTTTTGDNPNLVGTQTGYYEFKGLAPGSYVVQFFTGAGYDTFTSIDVGNDATDSDADTTTGKTIAYTLASGEFNQTVDAGLKPIDLSLTKIVASPTPAVGDNVVFTISVNNANGFSTATGVKVNDVLPAGLTFVNATPSQGTYLGNVWTIGTLTAGQTVTLAVTATVTSGGTKTNYAEVTAAGQVDTDSTPNNNSTNEDDDDSASLTPTAAIGDYVWLDLNANGQQDSGEAGLDGIVVKLLDSSGTTVLRTTTTSDNPNLTGTQQGYYEFKGLAPGSYIVQFFAGGIYDTFTTADFGSDASDSDANVTTGKTIVYTLASGDFNQTVDAGFKPIDLSLTKTVSNSAPAVGDNVTFTITVNNANGFSTATGVTVTDALPAGLTFVSATATQGSLTGNVWTIGTLNAGQTETLTITATVTTGGLKTNYAEVSAAGQFDTDSTPNNNSTNEDDDDQVSLNPTAAIGDYVWLDRNANGQQDSGELGIDGLTVKLLDSTGTSVLSTTTTGDNPNVGGTQQGYYEFKGLTPGSYVVQFFTGAGYDTFTVQDSGADATDSDADTTTGKTVAYTLASGDFNQTVDAGLKPIDLSLTKTISNSTPAVGDNVTFTISVNNANGFSTATGVEVKDVLPVGLTFVSATLSQGSYLGNTWTIGTLTANQTVTLAVTATVISGGTKTNYAEVTAAGQVDTDSTPNNNSANEDDDDQVSLTPTAAIGDYVWLDRNANGQQDGTESGIDGLTVNLLDSTGTNVLFTTTTGDNPNLAGTQQGYYEFKGLAPGSYVVQFFTGAGYSAFTALDVSPDATDSDADLLTGKTTVYTLVSGEFNQTVDAGLRPIDLSLSKTVSNSAPAVGDNVTFTLTVNNANGFSTATGVNVTDVLPAGLNFVSATPSQGTFAGNIWTIGTLTAGQTVTLALTAKVMTGGTKINYAEVTAAGQLDLDSTPNNNSNNEDDDDQVSLTPTAAIGDYVWLDLNANGQQDLGEPGIDGLMVQLLDSTGTNLLFTTTTGDDPNTAGIQKGYYDFKGLTPGSYVVQFYTGSGYNAFTGKDSGADATDSDADIATGKTAVYTLASGEFNQTVDAGLRPIDLSLTKSVSNSTPAVGDNVTFTVSVNNANGFSTATGVQVKDVLPAGLTFVSGIPSVGTYSGNTWTIGTLTAGQTVSLVVTATVATGGTKTNYAEVTAANQVDTDSTPNNNSTTEDDDDSASLTPTAAIGDYVWLDRNADGQQNLGEFGIDGLTVKLLNATGTTVLSTTTTGDNPNLVGTQTGYYEFKGLAPGSYVVQFFTGAGYDTFTSIDVGNDATDSDADTTTGKTIAYTLASGEFNQTVDAGLKPIDLSLTKIVASPTPAVGDNVVFTISVNNANGFSTATGVKVNDVLPAGLTFVSATPSQGTYAGNAWTIGTLTAGQTVTLAVTATVTSGGTKTNYAEVTAAGQVDTDSTPNNNSTNEDDDDSASLTPTAAIGDYVWLDQNDNGQQDVTESGISGLTVKLLNSTGTTVLYTTTTGDNPNLPGTQLGYYEFKGLAPGSYVVQFFTGGGYDTFTTADVGADVSDSDANVTTGKTIAYTLASGDFNQTVDAGLKPIDLSLTKSVNNTTPTVGSNVTYTLTVNNANGFSTATGVTVNEVLPTGMTFVSATPSQGTYAANVWTIGSIAAGQSVTLTITATVNSGGTKTNYAEVATAGQIDLDSAPNNNSTDEDDDDQVSLTPSASIGNYVWVDLNNNGIQDEAASYGVNGVTVTLFTSAGVSLGSTLTANNGSNPGYYLFTDIDPGSYYVVFTAPSGQIFTTTGLIAAAGNDSNADSTGKTASFTLLSGVDDLTIDAGLRPIDLSLTKTVNDTTPTVGSNIIYTLTVSNANGFSNASGVVVKDVLPTGLTFVSASFSDPTDTYAGNLWTIGNLNAGQFATLTITATVATGGTKTNYAEVSAANQFDIDSTPNNNSTTEDDNAQVSLTPSASIGNYVWVDLNNNGIQDEATSYGVNGVTVTLFTSAGVSLGSTLTANNGSNPGYYLFTDIDPGSYYVVFTAPSGQIFTTTGLIAAAGNDSNADSTGKTASFTLLSGVDDLTIDAGLRPIDLSLTKTVNDTTPTVGSNVIYTLTVSNANGFSNASGVVVKDVLPTGLTFVSASFSDPTDTYAGNLWTIGNLNAGQFATLTITATVATGGTKNNYAEVTAANQFDIDSIPNNNSTTEDDDDQVSLTPSANSSLGDRLWVDTNTDGKQDANTTLEPGLVGYTVTLIGGGADGLINGVGDTTATTTTGANGIYGFAGLTPGVQYQVQFSKPVGWVFTTANVSSNGFDLIDSDANPADGKTQIVTLSAGENNPTLDAGVYSGGIDIKKLVRGEYTMGTSGGTEGLTPGFWKTHSVFGPAPLSGWPETGYSPTQSWEAVFGRDVPGTPTLLDALGSNGGGLDALLRHATAGLLNAANPNVDYKYSVAQVISMTQAAIDSASYESTKNLFAYENEKGADLSTPAPSGTTIITPDVDADTAATALQIPVGGKAVFTYIVTNTGTAEISNVIVTDNRIASVIYVSGDTDNDGRLDPSETWRYTAQEIVTSNALITNIGTVTGTAGTITVTDNDAANYNGSALTQSLGDFIWLDSNANGKQDSNEAGISGLTVTLLGGGTDGLLSTVGDNTTVTTTTDVNGLYQFTGLKSGVQYQVQFTKPSGTVFTTRGAGVDNTIDSDADTTTGLSQIVTLSPGQNNPTLDAGVYSGGIDIKKLVRGEYTMGTSGGTEGLTPGFWKTHSVFGPAPLSGWPETGYSPTQSWEAVFGRDVPGTPTLLDALGSNGGGLDALLRHATAGLLNAANPNVDYKYSVAQVISMTQAAIDSASYESTKNLFAYENEKGADLSTPAPSGTTIITPDVDADTAATALQIPVGGKAVFTYIVTNTGTAEISNVIVTDNRIASVTYVSGDTDNDGRVDPSETWRYTAQEIVTSNALITNIGTVTGTAGTITVTDNDAANYNGSALTQSLGDFIWLDSNANGKQDSNEAGISGLTVTLLGGGTDGLLSTVGDNTTVTTTTDVNGLYQFTGLKSGVQYQVQFTKPSGTVFTTRGAGVDNTIDSNADTTTGLSQIVTLSPGQNDPTLDAGVYNTTTEITVCTDIATTGNSATSGTAGNILSFGSGNISVKASAFSRTNASPYTWNTAFLGSFSGGLGVTDGSESGSGDTHTVDNAGGRDNYVLFEFSQPVLIDKALLGYVAGDSDITVWIGTKNDPFTNHISLSDSMLSSMAFKEDNTTTLTSARTADINATGIVGNILIIAAQTSDTAKNDYFKIGSLKVCTPAKTKFFVVNDSTTTGTADRTYEYATGGTADENYALNSSNTAPRGASATAAGDKVWVVDANSKVYVYSNSGGLLGSWTATLPTGAAPEGISTNGTDVWIVTSDGSSTGRNTATERVFRFSGSTSGTGASRLSGSQTPVSSFALNTANLNPKDVVTDGTSLWVVNDASSGDKVFKYNLAGSLLGSWMIDAANTSPTGITLDPANVSNLWIVDNGTKRIYQYNGAASLSAGSTARPASTSFALSAGNTNPQGIADPPVWDMGASPIDQEVRLDTTVEVNLEMSPQMSPLFNAVIPTDVNGDGVTSPLDALLVINQLNGRASGQVYLDVNNDGVTSPVDALLVINYLDTVHNGNIVKLNSPNTATEQVFAELGEGESTAAFDELFDDVATQWGKTGGLSQGRRPGVRAK